VATLATPARRVRVSICAFVLGKQVNVGFRIGDRPVPSGLKLLVYEALSYWCMRP
jgi:hypothetical protein